MFSFDVRLIRFMLRVNQASYFTVTLFLSVPQFKPVKMASYCLHCETALEKYSSIICTLPTK